MKKIELFLDVKGWMARFPGNEELIRLFGTDTIPTAFTPAAEPSLVKCEIQKLNPGADVVVLGAR